jgi:hypothetical protein
LIPLYTILEFGATATEHVQGTANGQIDFAVTTLLHNVEVFDCPRAASVCHGNSAPLGKPADEIGVDTLLETFIISGMDEKLGAVRLEHGDAFWF